MKIAARRVLRILLIGALVLVCLSAMAATYALLPIGGIS